MITLNIKPDDQVRDNLKSLKKLKMSSFVQQKICPYCGYSDSLPIKGFAENIIGARTFPAGSFRFEDKLRYSRKLQKCKNCGLIYQKTIPSQQLLLQLYKNAEKRKPWPSDPRRMTWKRALQYLPPKPMRLLDVGANDGYFLSLLPPGWSVFALEPTAAAHSDLQKITNEIYIGFLDSKNLHLPSNFFDVVCLFDIAEHLRDVKTAMDNLANCLRPGGLAILETGNANCLPAKILKSAWWYYDYIEHLVFFNPKSLGQALKSSGFKIEYCANVLHTNLGAFHKKWVDLVVKMLAAWKYRKKLGINNDNGTIYQNNPLRVYWADHMFVVARKQ
jgi:SAM-dependent methyltransferase